MTAISVKQGFLLSFLCILLPGAVAAASVQTTDSVSVSKQYRYEITDWRLGLKTNLLADAVLPANLGMEFELAKHFSFEVTGGFSQTNVLFPCEDTRVYGFTPELRYWPKKALRKGHFFGLHSNVVWFTTKWDDGLIYQNISDRDPAWSVGLTYGYLLGLGKKDRWGLEFFLGAGYGQYVRKVGQWNEKDARWYKVDIQDKRYLGLTRGGINLIYRFDLKKVNVYDNNE